MGKFSYAFDILYSLLYYNSDFPLSMAAKVFHIPLIATTPSFNLAAIVQRKPTDDNSAPNTYPEIRHYVDAAYLFDDASIDVVIITTPPNTQIGRAHV